MRSAFRQLCEAGTIHISGRIIEAGNATLTHVRDSIPMRVTSVSKGRLVLKPLVLEMKLSADAVEGLIA